MKNLLIIFALAISSFAITPYSLEYLKEVNIKVLNKKKTIPKELEKRIENSVKDKLEVLGIKTKSDTYSNFLIKVKIKKIDEINFVRTSIFITEDVKSLRKDGLELLAITYKKEDSFEAEELETDIYESIIDYLLEDFIEQYKEEN